MEHTNNFVLIDEKHNEYPIDIFFSSNQEISYRFIFKQEKFQFLDRDTMWKYFHLIPLKNSKNILSLKEGHTPLARVPELEKFLNGAKFYCKNDGEGPTGTFKDREASYVISKVKEMGLKKIAFHSTGNTGRSYSVYAKKADIESFFFLPLNCMDKCDSSMINDNIHIIAVDADFNRVSEVVKSFSKKNDIAILAPLHDKLEGKATIAYEQFSELPEATMFVQTIAGGYGIIGFLLGHERLRLFGLSSSNYKIPRIIAIQSADNCTIARGMLVGKENISDSDLILPKNPFEKTLQSTNPLKTFAQVKNCLEKTNGLITVASEEEIITLKNIFEEALARHNIGVSYENEKSPYISFAGLVNLAREKKINSSDIIYMLMTGKGRGDNITPNPEAIVKPDDNGYEIIKSSEYLRRML